jgi:hypothetical protein
VLPVTPSDTVRQSFSEGESSLFTAWAKAKAVKRTAKLQQFIKMENFSPKIIDDRGIIKRLLLANC